MVDAVEELKKARKILEDSYNEALEKYEQKIKDAQEERKRVLEFAKRRLIIHKDNQLKKLDVKISESVKIGEQVIVKVTKSTPTTVPPLESSGQKMVLDDVIESLLKSSSETLETTKNTLTKVNRLSGKQVIGLSFAVSVCAGFVASIIFNFFLNFRLP